MGKPICKTLEIYEDDNGLYVKGQLSTTQLAIDARTLAKDGVLQGMSIGYWVKDYTRDQESGVYLLKKLKCYEYSFVTLPMNPEAEFTDIKSIDALETVRDCETYLRDVGGMSSKQAKRFISIIKNGRDDQDDKDQELASKLKQLAQRMEVNK